MLHQKMKINKEKRQDMIRTLQAYFSKEREEELGDLAAGLLLDFTRSGNLISIEDCYHRTIGYQYGQDGLTSVAQVSSASSNWEYTYETIKGEPHLKTISFPSPVNVGMSTQTISYDGESGKVSSFEDANHNRYEYAYTYDNGTIVAVKDPTGAEVTEYTINFEVFNEFFAREKGVTDADGHVTSLEYSDSNNPYRPTKVRDRNGHEIDMSYDQYGNLLSLIDSRGTVTTYIYETTATSPLGRLTSIQYGDEPETTISYDDNGLVHIIDKPAPFSTGGPTRVSTTFTYDDLGNVITIQAPAPTESGTMTITYDYGDNPKRGQPLTITKTLNGQSIIYHYEYDDRGNIISATDPLGNRTDFSFNLADQLLSVLLPPSQTP